MEKTLNRPPQPREAPAAEGNTASNSGSTKLIDQARGFARVARKAAESCTKSEEAQRELDSRLNGPGE